MDSSSGNGTSTNTDSGSDNPKLVYGDQYIMYTKNMSDSTRYAYQGKDSDGQRMWLDYGPKDSQK